MPIRLEYQPSPFSLGMAGYATGRGKARERYQQTMLEILQNERNIKARQESERQGFLRHQELQRQQIVARAEENLLDRNSRENMAEQRTRAFSVRDENKALGGLQKTLEGELNQIVADAGGHRPDTPESKAFWKLVDDYNDAMKRLTDTGNWDAAQMAKEAVPRLQRIKAAYNPSIHIIPRDKRPGEEYTDQFGDRWRRPIDTSKPSEYLGPAVDATDEQKAARKARRDATWEQRNGVWGQYQRDRYGNDVWKAVDTGGGQGWDMSDFDRTYKSMTTTNEEGKSIPPEISEVIKRLNEVAAAIRAAGQPPMSPPSGMPSVQGSGVWQMPAGTTTITAPSATKPRQPELPNAPTAHGVVTPPPEPQVKIRISPDGKWKWNGTKWIPVGGS